MLDTYCTEHMERTTNNHYIRMITLRSIRSASTHKWNLCLAQAWVDTSWTISVWPGDHEGPCDNSPVGLLLESLSTYHRFGLLKKECHKSHTPSCSLIQAVFELSLSRSSWPWSLCTKSGPPLDGAECCWLVLPAESLSFRMSCQTLGSSKTDCQCALTVSQRSNSSTTDAGADSRLIRFQL